MTRAIRLFVIGCFACLHLAGLAGAIYDPTASTTKPPLRREAALPWYLDGKKSSPPTDESRSPKWSKPDDFGETQSVEPPGKAWGNWHKVSGSDLEQRTEVEAQFGQQQSTGQFPTEESDKSWVGDAFQHAKDPEGPNTYEGPVLKFDDPPDFGWKETQGYKKKPIYKVPASSNPTDPYEGVPVDSKKPRQEKIFVPSRQTSTVAKYDQRSGVQCPHPQATGQFVYPPDCKFFVDCHQGRAYVQPCAPGTLFNPETLECDFPHKVKCYGGEIADFPSSDYKDDRGQREPLVNPPNHQYGHHQAPPRNEIRCQSQQSGYFAHPSDCTKFVQCDNGGTFIKDCGPGTVFNPAISVCDWPYNVQGCEDAFKKHDSPSTDLTPPREHASENFRSKPTNSWKPIPNAPQPVKKIACPAGHSGMLPHPETCKKFLQCASGITYIMDCGPGTAFNPKTSVCDWPYNVPGCSEDRPVHNTRPTERPQVPPTWQSSNPTYGRDDSETANGQWQSNYNPAGSANNHRGTNGQLRPTSPGGSANGHRGTNGQWQSGYSGGIVSESQNKNERWLPPPSQNPTRPFPPIPAPAPDYENIGDEVSQGNGYHHSHHQHYHQHHHHDHRHDGPGPWDDSEHNHGPESDEEGISQVPATPDYNSNGWQQSGHEHPHNGHHYPHSHHHEHGSWSSEEEETGTQSPDTGSPWMKTNPQTNNQRPGSWGWAQEETRTEGPDPDHPDIDIRSTSSHRGTSHRDPKAHQGWQRPSAPTDPSFTGSGRYGPTWNSGNGGNDGRMKPSQPEPAGTQPGVFVPSSWRGQGWSETGNQDSKSIPTTPPKNEWNQGGNKYPQDTKMDDWGSKTNIFNAQQGNKRSDAKISNVGPPGIYVNVNGTKGHYITKEIEITQGHSNTRNYGQNTRYAPPEKVGNTYNNSYGYQPSTDWRVPPPAPTYPSRYPPIRFNTTNTPTRWKPTKYKPVNKTELQPPFYIKPSYEQVPIVQPDFTVEHPPLVTEQLPPTRFDKTTQRTVGRGPRREPGIEMPTVSIEEDDRGKLYEPKEGKDYETTNFAGVVEPDTDKYDVDVLDEKESWKPRVDLQNKTKKGKESSVIMSINKKTTDVEILDVKLAPWYEDEPPFPVHYIAPVIPLGHTPKPAQINPASGQILRLRGGNSPRDGYLEVQGVHPGWGVVCDSRNGWSLNEAHVVCRQLGYTRGAEMAWQGRSNWDDSEIPWIAATEVACNGNETRFQTCKFVHGDHCQVKRDAVGIRCMPNRLGHCRKDEVAHEGQCYHLANPDSGLNHAEALQYCAKRKAQLVDITTQGENDFLSEWLLQTYPNITSIMTSGVGFTTFSRTLWLWEDSARAKFQFTKWWPGWMGDKKNPPWAGTRPVCVVMKKEFPCQERPETNCPADYFFWDVEDCAASMKGHSYVCERPYDDISCVYGKGQQYAGRANVSASGKDCLPWNDPTLAHAIRVSILNPEVRDNLMKHNYCRNPNPMKESRPWCFIGAYGDREYCDIPPCGNIGPKKPLGGQCKPKHFECMPGECIPSPWVCDGEEDCTNGLDEKSCSSHLGFFKKTKDHKLEGHDVEKWLNTPPKTCALRCKEADFTCRSFSHKTEGNVCLLSDTNVGATGDLIYDVDFDYYEMIDRSINCDGMFICGNNKCVNQDQVCNGKNDCGDRTDENICTVENLDYAIRLAGSNNSYEGRVEVKVLGHWGQVCDDGFGMIDADVICKELGFNLGAVEVRPGGYFGNLDPREVFMVDQLKCRGNETSLRECDFEGWGVHNCQPEEAVGVVCKTAVSACQMGHWKCDNSPACIPTTFICDEVVDCPDGSDESSAHCETPFELRLANGSSPLEGRVEVRHHGVWGTVCDDDFSVTAARVICRSLGYGGNAIAKKNGYFGPGQGPIWLDEVFCHGNEPQLYKCEHNHWGRHNCEHDEDAGVICTEGAVVDPELEADVTPIPEVSINELLPSDCGRRAEDFAGGEDEIFAKVIRGSVASKGSYPWQASIRLRGHSKSSHWCGAVVFSPLHVLTAAHCLEGYNKGTYFVRAGDYNSEIDEGTEFEANIEDFYIHEDFRKGQRMNNDIALVLLKGRGIPLGEHIMPICLPPANVEYSPGLNCTISGFGSIETGKSGQSLDLRYGWIPLLDQSVCRADYVYGEGNISDGMVCAGFLDEGVDSCDGDSGGPLACQTNGAFTLYGITSWGHHCGKANKPGVYVRVAHYRDWINQKIRESLLGR